MSKKIALSIQYCGGWGYKRYVDALAMALDYEFGSGVVDVVGVKDPKTSGNFEITFVPTGELIHSKTTRGQGKCESPQERAAVIEYIKAYQAAN